MAELTRVESLSGWKHFERVFLATVSITEYVAPVQEEEFSLYISDKKVIKQHFHNNSDE